MRKSKGASSFAWLHSLVIFIEWMAASNVVIIGKFPSSIALCATSLLSIIALSLPIVMSLVDTMFLLSRNLI